MPEVQSKDLVARLFELRWPGRVPVDEETRRYKDLSQRELETMVASLERASRETVERRTFRKETEDVRERLRTRQDDALAGLEALADRISARNRKNVPAKVATDVGVRDQLGATDEHREALRLLGQESHRWSVVESLQVRSALDEITSSWRKAGANELADIILKRGPDDLLTILKAGTGLENVDEAAKFGLVERYLEFAFLKTSWGVVRLLESKSWPGAGGHRRSRALKYSHALRSSVFEPAFLTDGQPALTAAAATEALAKLSLFGSEFQPSKIISIGSGGAMIGEFVRAELRLSQAKSTHWNMKVPMLRELARNVSSDDRILVVSDVAGSVREISMLREMFDTKVPGASLAFGALTAQASTYEKMRSESVVFFANLTADRDARLPWVRDGSYRRTSASHFFGHATPSPLRIARDFFDSVTNGLVALVR